MRFTALALVPLLPWSSAFVITDAQVFQAIEKLGKTSIDNTQTILDTAFEKFKEAGKHVDSQAHDAGDHVDSWLEEPTFEGDIVDFEEDHPHPPPPPHHPPHDGPPHDGPPHDGPPHEGPPHHKKPHHGDHGKPNRTVYELINESKYTTKLAKLINEYDDIVQLLNGTKANYTIFAPTDEAFEKIPSHGKKPSKEFLKDILLYHVVDDFYPAGRVLQSYTIPTLYTPEHLLGHQQRLTVRVTLKGPAINFYSRLVALDIFGTNGVVHGVSSILVPPPNIASIIDLLPGEFSTLELALSKAGLWEKINTTEPHEGGTFFAPSNLAFRKLGPRVNAFLFSKYGQKYLRALLKYHIVVDQTLYTDAFFDHKEKKDTETTHRLPYYHYDLPTVLTDKHLAVDVARYGPFISIKVNGFSRVTVHDGVASDGVIHAVSNVLIPPKNTASNGKAFWQGEELTVEDLKERLTPLVENMDL